VLTQSEYDRRIIYYRIVAGNVGVPLADRDDAAQDMLIRCWQSGWKRGGGFARRAAIDAVRRYGPYTRYGVARARWVPLDDALKLHAPEHALVACMDVRRALGTLTGKQRQALSRSVAGRPMTDADSSHAYAARRKLRAAMAA